MKYGKLWPIGVSVLGVIALHVRVLSLEVENSSAVDTCSTHTILPGPKGDDGEAGDTGVLGKLGKDGPKGQKGNKGIIGDSGDLGLIGKIGPIGSKGDKGHKGLPGLPGGKGKSGSYCDCGRYRKVVGQLDVNVAHLKSSLKFVKNVIAGIRETDEKYYYIVREERNYRDALTQCRIRGGTLAMPKDQATNSLIADYISKMGLFRVFIGINDIEKEKQFVYADNSPLQTYSSWKAGEPNDGSGYEDCVEMLSTGHWNDVDCSLTIYFVCEFLKKTK
ncbi:collectin-10 precursor [Xenopus tropicalis]|uniref:Collectin-10 n=1 Tax=Xenopus tropicalis TaxID=8364 RepID=COL10_XENTR|eukprot:NP_001011227.1 collectin-10 precursor [Xenopus tropicalis]